MTVAELIALLQDLPPDLQVVTTTEAHYAEIQGARLDRVVVMADFEDVVVLE